MTANIDLPDMGPGGKEGRLDDPFWKTCQKEMIDNVFLGGETRRSGEENVTKQRGMHNGGAGSGVSPLGFGKKGHLRERRVCRVCR